MDDRIAEVREALRDGYHPDSVVARAARAWADLLDSDALIIRRDKNGNMPLLGLYWCEVHVELIECSHGCELKPVYILDALALSQGVEP